MQEDCPASSGEENPRILDFIYMTFLALPQELVESSNSNYNYYNNL
jgi:hypothetical protein